MKRGYDKEAAFALHQAAERLYHCVLLVLTHYSPLCRAADYAERDQLSRFPNALAATGAA
jgi:uncharacterized protein